MGGAHLLVCYVEAESLTQRRAELIRYNVTIARRRIKTVEDCAPQHNLSLITPLACGDSQARLAPSGCEGGGVLIAHEL